MKRLLWFLVLFMSLGAPSAPAQQITYVFTGTVTSTDANTVTISEVQTGDAITGTFSYDTNALDQSPSDGAAGRYDAGNFSLTVNTHAFSAADNTVSVIDNGVVVPGLPAVDVFEVVSALRDVTGPSLSGLPPAQMDLVLVDTDASVFADDSLPDFLDLSAFEIVSEVPYGTTGGRLIFQSLATGEIGEVRFRLDSLSADGGGASYTHYIPHVTGGDAFWRDYLQVNNTGASDAGFDLILYDSTGGLAYSGTHTVAGRGMALIDLKSLAVDPQSGLVAFNDSALTFRLSQTFGDVGGVAEFLLSDRLHTEVGFFFSDFSPLIVNKGFALANFSNATASVTLTLIGNGNIHGSVDLNMAPNTKIVGYYQNWFPNVSFEDVQVIRAETAAPALAGETISSDAGNTVLLFTPAAAVQ